MNRWVIYQRERFPLLGHGPLVAAFSASAVCFSTLVRGSHALPPLRSFVVAFVTSLIFFFQLRVADEFKDAEDDARWRPYRPVPRGLVTLQELAGLGVTGAAVQLLLALWLAPANTWLLAIAWIYLALMTREFFVHAWLKRHPIAYMTSHMIILPLVDLYATSCDWGVAGLRWPPRGLLWFLLVSYSSGIVVEIGRKARVPVDEEEGVETYSALWGTRGAAMAWMAAIVFTAAAATMAAFRVEHGPVMLALLSLLVIACAVAAWRVSTQSARGSGRLLELMSGVWTICMYVGLAAPSLRLASWW